jgi:hypothetical protein
MNRSKMFYRDAVYARDVADAISNIVQRTQSEFPKIMQLTDVAAELTREYFVMDDGPAIVPEGTQRRERERFLSLLDPRSEGTLLTYGYDLYAESSGNIVVPVSDEFFGVLNGGELAECLDLLSDKEAVQALPRRSNPTAGLIVFTAAQEHNKLIGLWYARQKQTTNGQFGKLARVGQGLPLLENRVQPQALKRVQHLLASDDNS